MRLPSPTTDLGDLSDQIGHAWGVSNPESVAQYLAWSERSGLVSALAAGSAASIADLCEVTTLNRNGVDALISILMALKLVHHLPNANYRLTNLAKEYVLPGSPYYVGYALYEGRVKPIPRLFLSRTSNRVLTGETPCRDVPRSDRRTKLLRQHSRNFSPAVIAARTGCLSSVNHLIDVGGGSGVFAIPLALDNPGIRITLVDFPDALEGIKEVLALYGVQDRIRLVGMDVMNQEWKFPPCDGMLFGNFFHSFDDDSCTVLARRSFTAISTGGTIWLHEVLFNERRDGPLMAALWNANMLALRSGARQRTSREWKDLLCAAGFEDYSEMPTAAHFSLIRAAKRR